MNVPSASGQDIFDVRKIRRLVELMKEHDLSEIDLRQGEVRIQLRRSGAAAPPTVVARRRRRAAGGRPDRRRPNPTRRRPRSPRAGHRTVIKSPMVGTFYAAPDPESPPYVKVGDHVGPETTVCIVEAMKVFNEIPAEVSGRIVAVLAENGEPVEFGQPLFKVDTRQECTGAVFKRILVANRGEIALRIFRACRELGVETVAIFSEADRGAAYLELADEAYCVGPAEGRRQLPEDRPGHQRRRDRQRAGDPSGLRLSGRERPFRRDLPQLQDRVHRSHARGDGPGGRQERRPAAGQARSDVPTVPGSEGLVEGEAEAVALAHKIGFPVLIKAAAGGGGRGMRVALNDLALKAAIQQAQAEAEAAFGNGDIYLEKYIEHPRHVEVQVLADHHGNVVHLWERDCTMQRRHQKLIEESPAPQLDPQHPRRHVRGGGPPGPRRQLHQRRHGRVHRRSAGQLLLHRDQRPHPGRASRDRDGHRHRPDQGADPGGRRRAAALPPGRHSPAGRGDRVPHQRRGPGQALPAHARHDHAAARARRVRRPLRFARPRRLRRSRPTTIR